MSAFSYNRTQVDALRSRMRLCNQKVSPSQAWDILRLTHDLDLAETALLMDPRPAWVEAKVGSIKKTAA